MKSRTKGKSKGMAFLFSIKFFGLMFVTGRLVAYISWTYELVKNWAIPTEPFFAKVTVLHSSNALTVEGYLAFAIAYIVAFGLVILGMLQLEKSTRLCTDTSLFQEKIGHAFKKAGISFLIFAFVTFWLDTFYLFFESTSSRTLDLLSTELLVFTILGFLLLFLSDVFKEGITIREENELTI
mgnify:CR=1 FL=1